MCFFMRNLIWKCLLTFEFNFDLILHTADRHGHFSTHTKNSGLLGDIGERDISAII
jgi:hypothetical protein